MARPSDEQRTEILEGLKGISQDALLLQLKTLHSLRGSFTKAVAGSDFLIEFTRLQLSYYGELLQLVTGHFDLVAERLHDLVNPTKPDFPKLREIVVTAQLGGRPATSNDVSIRNPGPAQAT